MATKRSFSESMIETEADMEMCDDWDNPNKSTIRFKWLADGCSTIDEVIERLKGEIERYKTLKYEGWELTQTIDDDWGFMEKTPVVLSDEEIKNVKKRCPQE